MQIDRIISSIGYITDPNYNDADLKRTWQNIFVSKTTILEKIEDTDDIMGSFSKRIIFYAFSSMVYLYIHISKIYWG